MYSSFYYVYFNTREICISNKIDYRLTKKGDLRKQTSNKINSFFVDLIINKIEYDRVKCVSIDKRDVIIKVYHEYRDKFEDFSYLDYFDRYMPEYLREKLNDLNKTMFMWWVKD